MLKRRLFWWLLVVILLTLTVWLLSNNQGHVLIVRAPYRFQFSFNFLLFLVVMGFLSLHYLLRLMHYLRRLPSHWRTHKEVKNLKASHAALVDSLRAMVNEDVAAAEAAAKRANSLLEDASLVQVIESIANKKSKS
jgi:HemY protein